MTARFADTSYFLALLIPNDENHASAVALCISFTVMREHKLTDAMSADHHFEQAGFMVLLS